MHYHSITYICTQVHGHVHTDHYIAPPPKKPRLNKAYKIKAMESFMMYQCNADEQYQKHEEDRWQRDIELEEKRRREDPVNGSYNHYDNRHYDFDY